MPGFPGKSLFKVTAAHRSGPEPTRWADSPRLCEIVQPSDTPIGFNVIYFTQKSQVLYKIDYVSSNCVKLPANTPLGKDNVIHNIQNLGFLYKIDYIMPKPSTILYPSSARTLAALGQRLKDARLRRQFSAETVAARAGITRQTLIKIEAGNASVTMGNYFQVLAVLGLDKDMNLVARDDVLGRRLQDAALPQRQRAPRRTAAQMREDAAAEPDGPKKPVRTIPPVPLHDDPQGE